MNGTTGMARDPVCKAQVDVDEAIDHEWYDCQTYYFCSELCAEQFRSSPKSYVPSAAQA